MMRAGRADLIWRIRFVAIALVLVSSASLSEAQLARVAAPKPYRPAELPEGFAEELVATGIDGATGMAIAPDGRVFICEQTGALRIVDDGKLLDEPFVEIEVDSDWERGLIGVALDPSFPEEPFVYVCYVASAPFPHHRVSRFTARGNRAVPGSEVVLLEGDDQRTLGGSVPAGHQGGGIHFGPDGRLFVAIGEQTAGKPAQSLDTFQGKLLRIARDGSIPADNPFVKQARGKYRAIWALGLRNPFAFAFERRSGRLYVNDVGGQRFEEINEGKAGANYGWPHVEGPTVDARFHAPVHAYSEAPLQSIAGGAFYELDTPESRGFPEEYRRKYLFCDYILGWIRLIDPVDPWRSEPFASGLRGPVDVRVAPDGSLLVLERNVWVKDAKYRGGTGALRRIFWVDESNHDAPRIAPDAPERFALPGERVVLSVAASGAKPLTYRWERDGVEVPGATEPTLSITIPEAARTSDDAHEYRAIVSNEFGTTRSAGVRVRAIELRRATRTTADPNAPLACDCYESPSASLPSPSRARPAARTEARDLTTPPPCDAATQGAIVHGLLRIPERGAWSFRVEASGPVLLRIAGVDVLRGCGGTIESFETVGLEPGFWPFSLAFRHARGEPRLEVARIGPDGEATTLSMSEVAGAREKARPAGAPSFPETLAVPLDFDELPRRLSETGLFRSLADIEPAPGVHPYEIAAPAWHDGARITRFISVPAGAEIGLDRASGTFRFPRGTVFAQHLDVALESAQDGRPRGAGSRPKPLETRLLVVGRDGETFGASYKWRPSGDEATLQLTPLSEEIESPRSDSGSEAKPKRWQFLGAGDCALCHIPSAGAILGFRPAQRPRPTRRRNAPGSNEVAANSSSFFGERGLLAATFSEADFSDVPALVSPADASRAIEERVRSYLDANCSHCHHPNGVRAAFDARISTPLPKQALVAGRPIAADLGVRGAAIIAPGRPDLSLVLLRMSRRGDVFAMPPLGSTTVDTEGIHLIESWIRSLSAETRADR